MQQLSHSPASHSQPSIPINLPRYLARPDYREISKEAIAAVHPRLKDVDLNYILEGLEVLWPRMLSLLASVQARPSRNILPKELDILVNDASSQMPTHMFAVYSRQADIGSHRQVTLFPVHNIIFAAQCANLPKLASSPKPATSVDVTEPQTTTIRSLFHHHKCSRSSPPTSTPTASITSSHSFFLPAPSLPTPPTVDETDRLNLQQHARRWQKYTPYERYSHKRR